MSQLALDLILDEGKWLFASMLLAGLAVIATQSRVMKMSPRREVIRAMNVFYGSMIGTMAFGHLLAVTIRMVQGTLQGSLLILYPLGFALAIPAWLLATRVKQYVMREDRYGGRMVLLNGWLALFLLGMGLHNFPLAAPALLNVAYQFHRRPFIGMGIVTVSVAANIALFIGSIVFLGTGLSFEQFQRMN